MKKSVLYIVLFSLISVFALSQVSYAYWIWTPETKKFTNPKNAVKDTPKEQFEWAMSFYNAKDYQRAATEFDKLAKQYEFSDYAAKAQYYVGLCYEDMQKYYTAFENYQKAVDNFPHLANTDEVLARQYAIGIIYLEKQNPKVLGNDIMAPLDRAIEIFKKVVENAPYGKHAEDAQFKLGEALKKSERYEEAVQAYHKLVEDYPNSKHATQAMYEEANCAYKASLRPAYDAGATDSAIKTFKKFTDKNKDTKLAQEADTTMKRLKDNVAEKSFRAAEFYESQGKREAAIIYYQDVIDTYPDSSFVNRSKTRIQELKNLEKKKQNPVIREAPKMKPWKALDFSSTKPQSKAKTSPATQAPAKKNTWNPFNFENKKKEPVAKKIPQSLPEAPKVEPAAQVTATPAPVVAPGPVVQEAEPPLVASDTQIVQTKEEPKAKIWEPLNFDKNKEGAAKEAPKTKPWKALDFSSTKPQSKAKTSPTTQVPAKKSIWDPFNFENKKTEPAVKKIPEKKEWKPLSFEKAPAPAKAKPVEAPTPQAQPMETAAPVTQALPVALKVESIAQVTTAPAPVAVPEPVVQAAEPPQIASDTQVVQAQTTPKKKSWTPFSFDNKKEGAVKEIPKKKTWTPLNFGTNDQPMEGLR